MVSRLFSPLAPPNITPAKEKVLDLKGKKGLGQDTDPPTGRPLAGGWVTVAGKSNRPQRLQFYMIVTFQIKMVNFCILREV